MCAKINLSTWVWQLLYVEAVLHFSDQPLGLWIINLQFKNQLPVTSGGRHVIAGEDIAGRDVSAGEDIARDCSRLFACSCGREAFLEPEGCFPPGHEGCSLRGWSANAWARVLAQEKEVGGCVERHKRFQCEFGQDEENVCGAISKDGRTTGSPTCFRFHLQHLIWMFIKAFTSCSVFRVL